MTNGKEGATEIV